MGEVAARAAHLPDALVRLGPDAREMRQQRLLHPPRVVVRLLLELAPDVHGVHELAVDVELQLREGGVADAHGAAVLVTRQPGQLELGQAPLAGEAVDGLELGRPAGSGAHQPLAPGERLLSGSPR